MSTPSLPGLPLAGWEPTKDTLHLYLQIVGKVRLVAAKPQNHWWHVPFYVDVDGLTTRRMHRAGVGFEILFDLRDHALRVRAVDGREVSFALHDGLSVAEFDGRVHESLARLGVDVAIDEKPYGVPMTTPFPQDTEHASYDPEAVGRFWRALDWVDDVFTEFAGWYCGKQSPVHLFWHSFDLAVTRFSGREATAAAPDADPVTREAYSHEAISFGFWAGDADVREAALYSYTAPEPDGLTRGSLQPPQARWLEPSDGRIAFLSYEAVRASANPRRALLAFLQSAYDAGSIAAGWDREALASSFCPPPGDLKRLGDAASFGR
jgi:hypothetical protein